MLRSWWDYRRPWRQHPTGLGSSRKDFGRGRNRGPVSSPTGRREREGWRGRSGPEERTGREVVLGSPHKDFVVSVGNVMGGRILGATTGVLLQVRGIGPCARDGRRVTTEVDGRTTGKRRVGPRDWDVLDSVLTRGTTSRQ